MGLFGAKNTGKLTEARLRDAENRLAAISKSQALIEFNLDGTIVSANQNLCDAMGYAVSEIEGRHHSLFMDPAEAASQEYRDFWRDLNEGKFVSRKVRRLAKGGREVWLQAAYNPVLDGSGRAYRVIKVATDVTEVEQTVARLASERLATEHEQQAVITTIADSLRRLARGDLTVRITDDFQGGYSAIRTDFNEAVTSLTEVMRAIIDSTRAMQGGSDEIASASDDLSRRTEQQAASLEETAAALDEITATVKRSAAGANQASAAASGTRVDAEKSGSVVREAIAAMGEIEHSSSQITQIIGVIDEIAFQTNLLALNAGVEAARAGDAGRGFAVVAQEVRALAQRSADAAKQIKTLISASTSQVGRGVKLVGEAGQSLTGIVSKVAEIDALIADIALSSQEQATGLNQVNSAVNQMDQVTQQNAAMVEQSTAAATALRSEASELVRLVGRFTLDQTQGQSRPEVRQQSYARPQAAQPVASPARAPAPARPPVAPLQTAQPGRHQPAANPVARDRERLRSAFGGGGSGPLAAATADWTEF